jgi:hypothetical protein
MNLSGTGQRSGVNQSRALERKIKESKAEDSTAGNSERDETPFPGKAKKAKTSGPGNGSARGQISDAKWRRD